MNLWRGTLAIAWNISLAITVTRSTVWLTQRLYRVCTFFAAHTNRKSTQSIVLHTNKGSFKRKAVKQNLV
jgi:hypothetical protein